MFGDVKNAEVAHLTDINKREFGMLAALAAAVLIVGLWPEPLTNIMNVSVEHLLTQALQSKCGGSVVGGCL
jgi:NADH-quinone oxidoreductase subunit M